MSETSIGVYISKIVAACLVDNIIHLFQSQTHYFLYLHLTMAQNNFLIHLEATLMRHLVYISSLTL